MFSIFFYILNYEIFRYLFMKIMDQLVILHESIFMIWFMKNIQF